MPRPPAALLAVASLALAPLAPLAPLAAQEAGEDAAEASPRLFRVGLRAGVGVPLGAFASSDEAGGLATTSYGFAGMATLRPPRLPVAVRGELSYDRFGVDLAPFGEEAAGLIGSWGILGGTVNAVAELPAAGGVRPYLIGGAGVYRAEQKVSEDRSGQRAFSSASTEPGLNGGAGLGFRIGRFDSFLEVRYHTLFADERLSYVPIAVGVEF